MKERAQKKLQMSVVENSRMDRKEPAPASMMETQKSEITSHKVLPDAVVLKGNATLYYLGHCLIALFGALSQAPVHSANEVIIRHNVVLVIHV